MANKRNKKKKHLKDVNLNLWFQVKAGSTQSGSLMKANGGEEESFQSQVGFWPGSTSGGVKSVGEPG